MNEKSALEEFEFGKGEVGRSSGISALFSEYAETYVCFLNHGNVVGAITNRACYWLLFASFYEPYHL